MRDNIWVDEFRGCIYVSVFVQLMYIDKSYSLDITTCPFVLCAHSLVRSFNTSFTCSFIQHLKNFFIIKNFKLKLKKKAHLFVIFLDYKLLLY